MEIELDLIADQQDEFQKNPADSIKKFLTQEGHAFKDVTIPADHQISHLRSGWFHIMYVKGTRQCLRVDLCTGLLARPFSIE